MNQHRPPWRGAGKRFAPDRTGTVAIEWALVAIPFLAIVGAILDISYTSWASINLTGALNDAARTIQTGRFQKKTSGVTDVTELITKFRDQLCMPDGTTRRLLFVDCAAVKVQVQTFPSIGAAQAETPLDATTKQWSSTFGTKYSNAGANTIVVAQAAIKVPVWFNVLQVTQNFDDGSRLVQATAVFRTEPFN